MGGRLLKFKCFFVFVFSVLFVGSLVGVAFSQIDNSYVENSPLVLFDDNFGFWGSGGYGSGSVGITILPSTSPVQNGSSSLLMNVTAGNYAYVEVGHDFGPNQNWSRYDYLCFWFYGSNSSSTVEVALRAPNNGDQFWMTFMDNSTGWVHFVLDLQSLHTFGNPSLSTVNEIGFFFFNAPETFYVDRVILDSAPSSSSSPSPSPTFSPSPTTSPTASPAPTPAETPSPTASPSLTPTSTVPPTDVPTPSSSPTVNPTFTPTPSPSATFSPTPTSNLTPAPFLTAFPTLVPQQNASSTPTSSPVQSASPSQNLTEAILTVALWVGVAVVALCVVGVVLIRHQKGLFRPR